MNRDSLSDTLHNTWKVVLSDRENVEDILIDAYKKHGYRNKKNNIKKIKKRNSQVNYSSHYQSNNSSEFSIFKPIIGFIRKVLSLVFGKIYTYLIIAVYFILREFDHDVYPPFGNWVTEKIEVLIKYFNL